MYIHVQAHTTLLLHVIKSSDKSKKKLHNNTTTLITCTPDAYHHSLYMYMYTVHAEHVHIQAV